MIRYQVIWLDYHFEDVFDRARKFLISSVGVSPSKMEHREIPYHFFANNSFCSEFVNWPGCVPLQRVAVNGNAAMSPTKATNR